MGETKYKPLKKLAIITTHPIQYNAPLFALLSKRGFVDVKVFYTWGEGVLQNKYDPGFGKIIKWDIPLLQGYDYCFVNNIAQDAGSHHFKGINNPTLIKELENYEADAILIYGWAFKSHLKVLRHFHKKIPLFFRGDSISLKQINPLKQQIRQLFLKWVYAHVNKALYVGTHNKNYYLQNGLQSNQLLFAPHAIDNERFLRNEKENKATAMAWRNEIGILANDLVFLYAGKLDANKNTRFLIDAFLATNDGSCHLVIAGNGELENGLKKEYEENPNIHFLAFQNQQVMPVLYRMADVFVLPCLNETWGLSINEAMVCGCALLVSKQAGAAIDLVKEGENGFSFDPVNSIELKERLLFMIQNKDLMNTWGAVSVKEIEDWNYTNICLVIETLMK
jgi:glycosyltransferase involved in cell wall biosynthesis